MAIALAHFSPVMLFKCATAAAVIQMCRCRVFLASRRCRYSNVPLPLPLFKCAAAVCSSHPAAAVIQMCHCRCRYSNVPLPCVPPSHPAPVMLFKCATAAAAAVWSLRRSGWGSTMIEVDVHVRKHTLYISKERPESLAGWSASLKIDPRES